MKFLPKGDRAERLREMGVEKFERFIVQPAAYQRSYY
jgi:hypothetical protein